MPDKSGYRENSTSVELRRLPGDRSAGTGQPNTSMGGMGGGGLGGFLGPLLGPEAQSRRAGLGLRALRGVHQQHRPLARVHRAADLVRPRGGIWKAEPDTPQFTGQRQLVRSLKRKSWGYLGAGFEGRSGGLGPLLRSRRGDTPLPCTSALYRTLLLSNGGSWGPGGEANP